LKKIVGHYLRKSDSEKLKSYVVQYRYEYSAVNDFDKLLKLEQSELAGLFIFVDEQTDIIKLETILKHFTRIPVAVILKYKDFDLLMTCYKYRVKGVFIAKMEDRPLENLMVQIDLFDHEDTKNLPVKEIAELISSPVKIKTNEELFHCLERYFQSFENIEGICLFDYKEDVIDSYGDVYLNEAKAVLNSVKLPRKYIGFEVDSKVQNQEVIYTPVFCPTDGEQIWLSILMAHDQKRFILNNLFYKHLENVLIYRMNKEKEKNLTILASTDDVTGLFNQRKLSQDLESAVKHHEKHDKNFSIMFIDVDHFKIVNDNYGHVVGSKLLQDIGEVLALILRTSDHIYRYGGDEFVVIMPTVNIKTVHEVATRVLQKIKNKTFDLGNGETYNLSVSIGIAEYPTDASSAIDIIRFADEMMYMSKRSGRGKVFHINEVQHVDASSE